MQVLHETFENDPRVQILSAHVGTGDLRMSRAESVTEYAEAKGLTYPMVEDGRGMAEAFEITDIPYFVVLAPDGTIVAEHLGRLTDEVRDELAAAARAARAD